MAYDPNKSDWLNLSGFKVECLTQAYVTALALGYPILGAGYERPIGCFVFTTADYLIYVAWNKPSVIVEVTPRQL